jgi:hypothetical protein
MLNQSIHRITSKPSSSKCIKYILKSDVHHGNYNPSRKVKSNMQEDSDGPMTRARGKQLQRALTSQIGMMETASELKISNQFEIGSRVLICLQLELRDGKSP